jgi:manganese oxidase
MELDRRHFLGASGAGLLCTLAGQRVRTDEQADLRALAGGLEQPAPRAAAAQAPAPEPQPAPGGVRREFWVQAEPRRWTIVPGKRDEMMDRPIRGRTTFDALVYREYEPRFARPKGLGTMPGPKLEAVEGDLLVVHFRNRTDVPVTMHPHGVYYPPRHDGAFKGRFTSAGGFVVPGGRHTYVWECREGTAGVWPYHDHGPLDPLPMARGLFGALVVRRSGERPPDAEHVLVLHALGTLETGLRRTFHCVNGRAFAGSTPTFTARVGQRVAQHVIALGDGFHTYHLHGHRWRGPDGVVRDTATVGPAERLSLEFVEDNPGRWAYHCHVPGHQHEGMAGWYVVR